MNDCKEKYYGKYRGTVVLNEDPKRQGRIQVLVPDVSGIALSNWAMPCVPIGGLQSGISTVPPIGSGVWVEFEQGDPDYPIWSGGFWGSAADPPPSMHMAPPAAPNIVLQTIGQNSITLFGAPGGGITISGGPMTMPLSPKIMLTPVGIEISVGLASIKLSPDGQVRINNNSLLVMP
ncbi:phage baseplate assembly protein V [Desulfogranum japonicum]|uniref:phage baseplate assembly protein V n=1 Tax=Desulfogranum japonicum TaxID=231447 RepID=UPI00042575A8|nr:phage baseplate assembly protein V [Desulfogranum japonicum]